MANVTGTTFNVERMMALCLKDKKGLYQTRFRLLHWRRHSTM